MAQTRSHWSDSLPTIIRPSFWGELYPSIAKRIRERGKTSNDKKEKRKKEWNPATYFIWMAMLIGSQSINLILLKNEWAVFSRQADAKIARLKDVLERVQRGEDVDVEKELGTGDEIAEREWKEVVKELEQEDRLWEKNEKRRRKRKQLQEAKEAEQNTAKSQNQPSQG